MNQTALDLDPPTTADRIGFQLGLDHARHGLAPEPALMGSAPALREGWTAGRALFGIREARSTRGLRSWLDWRTRAWRAGRSFDLASLTPTTLEAMRPTLCPVTRRPLGGLPGTADAPVLLSLSPQGDFRACEVAWVSQAAATATTTGAADPGVLDAAAGRRLDLLLGLRTPVAHRRALRLPLCLLPPPGIEPACAAQQLQLALTLELAAPGWSTRLRQMADLIDDAAQRLDFQLLIGALAPRALELPESEGPLALRHGLEDLWLHPRVMQRWSTLALTLGESGCTDLLRRAAAQPSRQVRGGTGALPAKPVRPRRWPAAARPLAAA